jgi:hypothetical protein
MIHPKFILPIYRTRVALSITLSIAALTTIITGPTHSATLRATLVLAQGDEMHTATLHQGDQVRTESGSIGTVVHTSRLTAFVAFVMPEHENEVKAFLESQLTKVAPPERK